MKIIQRLKRWLIRTFASQNVHKLGAQCQQKSNGIYEYNRVVQPGSIKGINIIDADFWKRIWEENPYLQYAVYRECPNGPDPFNDPEGAAIAWISHLKSKMGHLVDMGLVTHVEGYNEWVHSFQTDRFTPADRFMATEIDECHKQFGGKVHIIVGNFGCGHFSDVPNADGVNIIDAFPKTLKRLNECSKCFLGMHEYDKENMDRIHQEDLAKGGDGYWLCGKFLRVEQALKDAGYDNIGIAITEVGLDDAVDRAAGSHHWGWRHYGDTIEQAVTHLLDDHNLGWYYPLAEGCDMVRLLSFFGCSMFWPNNWGEWGFDLANEDGSFPNNLLGGIKNLEGAEPSPPEPSEEESMVKVYDFTHEPGDSETKDWTWLEGVFGDVQVHTIQDKVSLKEGDIVYKLDYLDARVGDANIIINVRDLDGNPVAQETVVFGWPDAPPHELSSKPSNWTTSGVIGDTNVNGDVGPGLGDGAYYDPKTQRGPHFVWVWDLPSDMVDGLGMLPGGEPEPGVFGPHAHLNLGYRAVRWTGEEPEPGPEPGPNPLDDIITYAEAIIERAKSIDVVGAPIEIELTYSDGRVARYELTPTSNALARIWAKILSLAGRNHPA